MMDLQAFEGNLDRWGTPERWPAAERVDGEALLAVSEPARASLAALREVEAALAWLPAGSEQAAARFAAVAVRNRQERPASAWARRSGWGAAVAAALALGVLVGQADGGGTGWRDDNPDRVLANALDPTRGTVDVD